MTDASKPPPTPEALVGVETKAKALRSALNKVALKSVAEEALHRIARKSSTIENVLSDHAAPEEIDSLCRLLLSDDFDAGRVFIDEVRQSGASLETVHLAYLAAVARKLGELWEADQVSFFEVTQASLRLYAIIRALNREVHHGDDVGARRAVFAVTPGDTHIIGVTTMQGLLEDRGWAIDLLIDREHDELVSAISAAASVDTTIVGLSAGSVSALPALSRLIVALRIEAPQIRIVVGGQVLEDGRNAVIAMEPDGLSEDWDQTYALFEKFARKEPSGGTGAAFSVLTATGLLSALGVTVEI